METKPHRLILDANMLVIYSLGTVNPELLGKHRRARDYMPSDYDLLTDLMGGFDTAIVTPNAVTECSNLFSDEADSLPKKALHDFLERSTCQVEERYVESKVACRRAQYTYLGVSDCAMLELVDQDTILLTADANLSRAAQEINPLSLNFNHFRDFPVLQF